MEQLAIKVNILLYYSGVALEKLGKFNEAIVMFDRSIQLNPNQAGVYFNKGLI